MSAHTKGPWEVIGRQGYTVWAGNEIIAQMPNGRTNHRQARANALVMAASLDLLEAAQAAMNCIGELRPTQARVEVAQMLSAAIAKATGEA
jgi:RES domain-containing protein